MATIRPLSLDDMQDCAQLLMKSYNQPPWRCQWNLDKALIYLTEYFEVKQFLGFVICEGSEIVGAVFCHSKTWWTTDQLYVDELFISPDKQRAGYGKMMLDHIEQYAKENGLGTVFLMTNKYMPSFKFYNKIHFSAAEHLVLMFKQVQ